MDSWRPESLREVAHNLACNGETAASDFTYWCAERLRRAEELIARGRSLATRTSLMDGDEWGTFAAECKAYMEAYMEETRD